MSVRHKERQLQAASRTSFAICKRPHQDTTSLIEVERVRKSLEFLHFCFPTQFQINQPSGWASSTRTCFLAGRQVSGFLRVSQPWPIGLLCTLHTTIHQRYEFCVSYTNTFTGRQGSEREARGDSRLCVEEIVFVVQWALMSHPLLGPTCRQFALYTSSPFKIEQSERP